MAEERRPGLMTVTIGLKLFDQHKILFSLSESNTRQCYRASFGRNVFLFLRYHLNTHVANSIVKDNFV